MKVNNPIQPLVMDGDVLRFKKNKIVEYLLDHCARSGIDMNHLGVLARYGTFNKDDQEQFAQLIGYSLSGFCELTYVRDETYRKVMKAHELLRKK